MATTETTDRFTAADGRRFAFPVGIAFAALAGVTLWRGHLAPTYAFGGLAGILVLAGAVMPSRLGPVHSAWMAFAHAISRVTTPIVLTLMYLVAIVPTGLLMRGLGRNPLDVEPGAEGYWVPREGAARRSDLNRQF